MSTQGLKTYHWYALAWWKLPDLYVAARVAKHLCLLGFRLKMLCTFLLCSVNVRSCKHSSFAWVDKDSWEFAAAVDTFVVAVGRAVS